MPETVGSGRADLRCAECGERIAKGRLRGGWVHRSRGVVAACDIDSDHRPVPDWAALGELTCAVCGGALVAGRRGALAHADPDRDADHEPEPDLTS